MPRVIGENVENQADVIDPIGGDAVRFFYRTPTTKERVAYSAQSIELKGVQRPKAKLRLSETRQTFGAKILTGIREGDILFKDDSGSTRPLTTETPDWRKLVAQYAPELVEALAALVFEGAMAVGVQEDEEDAPEAGEDGDPLE